MTTRVALVFLAALLPVAADAGITNATLFPSHGMLTWEEVARIEAGKGRLTIRGLPASLVDNSLQLQLTGSQEVEVRQVQVRRVEQARVVAEQTRDLQQQLQQVMDTIRAQEDEIRAWEQQVRLMEQVASAPGDQLRAGDLGSLADTLRNQTRQALAEVRGLRQALRDQQAEKDRLERQLEQVRNDVRATKSVTVNYQAETAGPVTARLTFQTPDAGWYSRYNARLDTNTDSLILEHEAVIRQQTGLDWPQVQLQLSTLSARFGSGLPDLPPWIVEPVPPQVMPRSKAAETLAFDAAPVSRARAQVADLGQHTQAYSLPHPVSLESRGTEQRLTISSTTLPVQVRTRLIPAVALNGYVYATGTYSGESTLPAGAVSLYRDGLSVGDAHLAPVEPGTEISLGFGRDDRVTVKVVREQDQQGEKGVFRGEKYLSRMNRYEVTNHHPRAVRVRVLDRLPVSRHDALKITHQGITEPVERNVDDKAGVLAWNRQLPAGETLILKAGFEVRVPEEQALPEL